MVQVDPSADSAVRSPGLIVALLLAIGHGSRKLAGMILVVAWMLGSGAAVSLEAQEVLDRRVEQELVDIVSAALDSVPAAGWAVGVVRGDSLIYARGFGFSDLEAGTPVTPETLFQIASVSKSFTATMAAALADQGVLELDAPASSYLWNRALENSGITVTHLAEHTSGLPADAPGLRRLHHDYPVLAFTHFELYQGLEQSELAFRPGSTWGYSNFGYGVLGHILEIVSNTPYEVLVEREIFEPLGMASSTVTIWPEAAADLATPYYQDESGTLTEYTPWDPEALAPASGIAANLVDMGRYLAFHTREARAGGVAAQTHAPRVEVNDALSQGLAWFIEDLPGVGRVLSIGGDLDGYVGEIAFSPEHGIGTIIMANSDPAGPFQHVGRWLIASTLASEDPAAATEARYRRAAIHQGLREWAHAVAGFQALTEKADPHRPSLYQLGRTGAIADVYLREAEEALQRYLQLEPYPGIPHEAARWRLGNVLEQMGRCGAAREQYQAAAANGYEPARRSLEQLGC